MKRLLRAVALAGLACAASAQGAAVGGPAKTFAGIDSPTAALQPHLPGARSFNDMLADTEPGSAASRSDSQFSAGVTASIPEPQTYALLLAGLGAIVFVAVRRRRP